VFCGCSGAFDSALTVGVQTYIADLVPSADRATTFGRVLICPFVALSLASPLGAVYAAAYKESALRSAFWLAALLSAAPAVFVILFLAEPRSAIQDSEKAPADGRAGLRGKATPLVADCEVGVAAHGAASGPKARLWTRGLVLLVAICGMTSFGSMAIHSLLVLYLANRFVECAEGCISFLFLLLSVCFVISSLLFLPVAIRLLGNVRTMMVGLLFSAAFIVCFASATSLNAVFLAFILEVPAMGTVSCLAALFTEAVPKEHVGFASGVNTATMTLMQVASPVFFAFLLTEWLRYPASATLPGLPWLGAAALQLVALALCLFIASPPPPLLGDDATEPGGADVGGEGDGDEVEYCRASVRTTEVAAGAARGAGATGGARDGARGAASSTGARVSLRGLPAAAVGAVSAVTGGDRGDIGNEALAQPLLQASGD